MSPEWVWMQRCVLLHVLCVVSRYRKLACVIKLWDQQTNTLCLDLMMFVLSMGVAWHTIHVVFGLGRDCRCLLRCTWLRSY